MIDLKEIIPFVLNTNKQDIFGIIDKPKNANPVPVVIILHGFTGNHIGSQFKLSLLAKKLAKIGIASVRFDFRGSGNSDGEFENMTISSETNDAKEIIKFVESQSWFNGKYAILGYSMGGVVASSLIRDGFDPNCLAFWSPAFFNKSVFGKIEEYSLSEVPVSYKGFLIGEKFRKEILEKDYALFLKKYKKNVLVVHGNKDETVDIKKVREFSLEQKYYFHEINDATHTYENIDHLNDLLDITVSFLGKNLIGESV
ncbi:MAG: uncharacterized protein PWQ77_69 [Kosmotogales bacterium]|nr:uncharacterized protein [Kosmotogales bacterium]